MKDYYEISSTQSAETLLNRLKEQTLIQPRFRYMRWIDGGLEKQYYGEVNDREFKISLYLEGRNFFTPIIEGGVSETDNGSALYYQITSSPDIKKTWFFIGTMLLIFCVALLSELNDALVFAGDDLVFILFPFGLFLIATVFCILNNVVIKKFKKDVFEKLSTLAE